MFLFAIRFIEHNAIGSAAAAGGEDRFIVFQTIDLVNNKAFANGELAIKTLSAYLSALCKYFSWSYGSSDMRICNPYPSGP